MYDSVKENLLKKLEDKEAELIDICKSLVKIPSETPPSDTQEISKYVIDLLSGIDGVEVNTHTMEHPIINVVAKVHGNGSGKRLILNGHLDTFPIGDASKWTVDPLSAEEKDGRIYGRGTCDMKAGVACHITSFILLAEHRDLWSGEVVLTLVGDEEQGGIRGTKYLVDTLDIVNGDAMINGDTGSPSVLRFGEKGQIVFDLFAEGKEGHAAHIHKGGINAIEILTEGMTEINNTLRNLTFEAPKNITEAIEKAAEKSEKISGVGETEVLQSITSNFGVIEGGIAPNIIPGSAKAKGNVRLPVGISVDEIEANILSVVEKIDGLSYSRVRSTEPNYSDINHEIFQYMVNNAEAVLGEAPALTMRVGASDSRYFRNKLMIPSINCGLTPHNMGGPDEYIIISELMEVTKIHLLTAYDFLKNKTI